MDEMTEMVQEAAVKESNLALSLKKEELTEIGNTVVKEYKADVESRVDFDKRRAGWVKLFSGMRDPKDFPWPNASNTHLPLLSTACLQFQSRAYEALLPSKEIAKCLSTDGKTKDAAERAAKYLNYQLSYGMEEWEEDMDALLMYLPIMGSCYKKTYYDPILKRPVSKMLGVDEFVTPYKCKRLEDAPRKTHIIWMSINDIKKRMDAGIFLKDTEIPMEPVSDAMNTPMPEYRQEVDKSNNQSEPLITYQDKRPILEQHRLLDLNYSVISGKFEKKDGIQRPYVVWVDLESERVMRIIPLEYVDALGNIKVMEYFTAYPFIPNPESHYAFGFGHLIDHINEAADSILNQLIDAGTLSNVRGGFVRKRSGVKRGKVNFEMGVFHEVDTMSDDIRKDLFPIDFKPPSNVLFTLLGLLQTYVKDLTTTADWMSGQLPPSDTAATTMLAVIEQGLKVFSTIQKRCHRALKRELKKIFILNSVYMDEAVYFTVQDSTAREIRTLQSGKADFANQIDVMPVSDPNITSRAERLIKSQQALANVRQSPLTANDLEAQYIVEYDYYEALGYQNIDTFLKKPQPPPPPPDLPPTEENAMILKETITPALPQQDHAKHIMVHDEFVNSIWYEQVTPNGKNLLDAHRREHLAFAYLKEQAILREAEKEIVMGAMEQGGRFGNIGGNGGGVPQGMEVPRGNESVLEQFEAGEGTNAGRPAEGKRAYTRIGS
jgi:chaperonin GroES